MKSVIKVLLLCLSFVTASAYAVTLNGSLAVGGAYTATGGSGLADATGITLNDVFGNPSNGDFSAVNGLTPPGTGGSFNFDPFAEADNIFTIDGWTLDVTTLDAGFAQTATNLLLTGTGVLSGHGFDATVAEWSFSVGTTGPYSMTATASGIAVVPVPAAVWLFGSGLIGLVAVSRRKA